MPKEIVILGETILPGKSYQLSIDIARLHTRTKIEVPVIVSRAEKDGPCVLISAGIHGDEVNGIEIVRQLISRKYNVPEAGMIICVPVLNVFGFISKTRKFPDGRDLNRSFPGSKSGSLAGKFAYYFMHELVPYADYCIDLHTGAADRFNYSQIRISNDNETLKLAKAFGVKFIKYSSVREKSYRDSATRLGKKVLLFEGGKSLDLDRDVTQSGLTGVLKVLEYLNLKSFPNDFAPYTEPSSEQIIFENSKWLRANYSGMYRSTIRNGQPINKGDTIGTITDPYGFFEKKVKSSVSGHVICLNHSAIVTKGDAIAHIAIV